MKLGKHFKQVYALRKFKQMNNRSNVSEAFAILKEAIQKDESYAYGWHANIAMALHDSMPETFWMPDRSEHHKIANEAASAFMMRCWDVKTSADMLTETKEDVVEVKGIKHV